MSTTRRLRPSTGERIEIVPQRGARWSIERYGAEWVCVDPGNLAMCQKRNVRYEDDPWVALCQVCEEVDVIPGLFHIEGVPVLMIRAVRGHHHVHGSGVDGVVSVDSGLICLYNQNDVNAVAKQDQFSVEWMMGEGVFRERVLGTSRVSIKHKAYNSDPYKLCAGFYGAVKCDVGAKRYENEEL